MILLCFSHSVMSDCDSTYCSLPDSSVHGNFQAGIQEWVAMPCSRGSSQTRDWTLVSRIAGGFFTRWATRESPYRRLTFSDLSLRCSCEMLLNTDHSFFPMKNRKFVCSTSLCLEIRDVFKQLKDFCFFSPLMHVFVKGLQFLFCL